MQSAQLTKSAFLFFVASLACAACGDDPAEPAVGTVAGAVTSEGGGPLVGAAVSIGSSKTATTGAGGAYVLTDVAAGSATIQVSSGADWEAAELTVTVVGGQTTTADVELAIAVKVLSADRTLADTYNQTFDWTQDKKSVVYVPGSTRNQLERAIYWHNPALYSDRSGEPSVVPATRPSVAAPSSFDFPVTVGPNSGQQALDTSSVVNAISATALTTAERADSGIWETGVERFLKNWDLDAMTPLFAAGLAVRGQQWGASVIRPQEIESYYLHTGELWVKIVFQAFVTVAADVTDTDGDGLPEVFAKVLPAHVPAAAYAKLRDDYHAISYGSRELRAHLDNNVNALYSRTNAAVIGTLGIPYALDGVGTFAWPFAVVGHGTPGLPSYVINVLLVEP